MKIVILEHVLYPNLPAEVQSQPILEKHYLVRLHNRLNQKRYLHKSFRTAAGAECYASQVLDRYQKIFNTKDINPIH